MGEGGGVGRQGESVLEEGVGDGGDGIEEQDHGEGVEDDDDGGEGVVGHAHGQGGHRDLGEHADECWCGAWGEPHSLSPEADDVGTVVEPACASRSVAQGDLGGLGGAVGDPDAVVGGVVDDVVLPALVEQGAVSWVPQPSVCDLLGLANQ